ncbi:MAG: CPBP family intramembrane glutamic endopeptidase [Bacteroidota bacterium]
MDWERLSAIVNWNEEALPAVLAIGVATIGFIIYYFTIISEKLAARFRERFGEEAGQARWVIAQRLIGAAVLGIPSLILIPLVLGKSPAAYGISFSINGTAALYIAVLGAIIIPMNLFRAGKPANLVHYPQIRTKKWDVRLLGISSISWVLYLLGYEILFRGLLLFGCVEALGVWPALAINASIYSFAHFFKGIGETVGAIPFGIVISILCLHTGNFMVAFIVHCFLALSNQTVAVFKNPEIEWVKG